MSVPPPWLQLSAFELAAALRRGELRSRALVEAHYAAMRRINPLLNAVVASREEAALAEADLADRRLAGGGELPPLLGVPCTIKESFALTGMPWTAGLLARRGRIATEDAPAVGRWRAAGAIPLGVTNTSELCMWMESDNLVYGRTGSAFDPARTAGGSSGGEGAAIGAGLSPFGLGADVGGSIRMPAFFNGVFGHKPSPGIVPNAGQHPEPEGPVGRTCVTGPLARRASDLWPLLQLLAGPDPRDPHAGAPLRGDPRQVDLRRVRVLDVPWNGVTRPAASLRAAQERLAGWLRAAGAQVQTLDLPFARRGFWLWAAVLGAGQPTPFGTLMGEGRPVNPWRELGRWALGRPRHTPMASLLALAEGVTALQPRHQAKMLVEIQRLRLEMAERLGEDGVLLYPSYPRPAPPHGHPFRRQLRLRFDYQYTALINALELPATQVPLGLDAEGLPLGCQVVAGPGQDALAVAVALEVEARTGGWQPPARWWGAG